MIVIHPQRALSKQVLCFTTTRFHGVSARQYGSLNLASHVEDDEQKVTQNRSILQNYLEKSEYALNSSASVINANAYAGPMQPLHYMPQNHSSIVQRYDVEGSYPQNFDAIYTQTPRTPLVVLTADCLPIMISHIEGFEVAAIHAGYKGLTQGIIQNTLEALGVKSKNLSVWIGPSICEKHFEVGEDILHLFADFHQHVRFNPDTEKFYVGLQAIAIDILRSEGITHIQTSEQCTYCSDELFSHRQATHQGHKHCGRMASVIMHL